MPATTPKLTDKQIKTLRERMFRIGREKLIDRLEGALINKNLQDDTSGASRIAQQIEYVRSQTGWVTHH